MFRKGKVISIDKRRAGDHPRVNGGKTLRHLELSSCPSLDRLSVGLASKTSTQGPCVLAQGVSPYALLVVGHARKTPKINSGTTSQEDLVTAK